MKSRFATGLLATILVLSSAIATAPSSQAGTNPCGTLAEDRATNTSGVYPSCTTMAYWGIIGDRLPANAPSQWKVWGPWVYKGQTSYRPSTLSSYQYMVDYGAPGKPYCQLLGLCHAVEDAR
jgi:hypothetical protein